MLSYYVVAPKGAVFGGDLRIQDGGAHESRPCWKTTSTEDWDRSYRFPWRHKSRQGFRKMSRNFKIHGTNFDK